MLTLGGLAFATPWMLAALALIPAIWWLLRVTPPAPRRVNFPAVALLLGLKPTDESAAHTPWWLLLLRLLVATLVILALAKPLLNPSARLSGSGPLLLVIDDGWASARHWTDRQRTIGDLLDQAARTDRPVSVLTTASLREGAPPRATDLMTATAAKEMLAALAPKPWPVDHEAARLATENLPFALPAEVAWLSDGLAQGAEDVSGRFAGRLSLIGPFSVFTDEGPDLARVLRPPSTTGSMLSLTVERATPAPSGGQPTVIVRASGDGGQVFARHPITFADDALQAKSDIELPSEVRNRISRLDIEGEASAGAVVLFDERWRRRPVGLVSGGSVESAQPLLSDIYYLERALEPFSEVRRGVITELLDKPLAVLVLGDVGQVVQGDRAALDTWLNQGGVLVRFAGPRLAENVDDLVPVQLRGGTRALGGALTWGRPAPLGDFPEASPFAGLPVPKDVHVTRQVLAEPSLDLAQKTWARLADGTPLVTAERRGRGWLVLFHITANTGWSDLPISGLFVDMLRRMVALSQGVAGAEGGGSLPPLATLDGFGRLGQPPATALPLRAEDATNAQVGPGRPPGYYGTDEARRALNLSAGVAAPRPLGELPPEARRSDYATASETNLMPWLLLAALILLLTDIVASLALRGQLGLRAPRTAAGALALAALVSLGLPRPADAQQARDAEAFAMAATLQPRLAYVITGQAPVDDMSRAGMVGLTTILNQRTAIEPSDPVGVDVERDELAFFSMLYWPIDAGQRDVSAATLAKLDTYMKNGGTILFDTRDQQDAGSPARNLFEGRGSGRLRQILSGLDIPPLMPVPEDHVLTKAFYLLREFPGRYAGGTVWVERHQGGSNDGVSGIIIGGADWAAAWAIDAGGKYLAPTAPGGPQQREMAYRFGVNLVMYAFTGNYKADQVHVPAILERLGQ